MNADDTRESPYVQEVRPMEDRVADEIARQWRKRMGENADERKMRGERFDADALIDAERTYMTTVGAFGPFLAHEAPEFVAERGYHAPFGDVDDGRTWVPITAAEVAEVEAVHGESLRKRAEWLAVNWGAGSLGAGTVSDRDHPAIQHPALGPEVERGVDALAVARIARPMSDIRARRVLADLAWIAYKHGQHNAIHDLLTTRQVSERLGISPLRVRQIAHDRGVGWNVEGALWLFREEDVEALRPKPPGRPRNPPAP